MADIVDLTDYVQRYENEYIVFHTSHFVKNDVAKANEVFSKRYAEARARMAEDALTSQLQSFKITSEGAAIKGAEALALYEKLGQSGTIEQIFDQIAAGLNQSMSKQKTNISGEFTDILQQLRKSKSSALLASGKAQGDKITQFFNLLFRALNLTMRIPIETLDAFTDIANRLSLQGVDTSQFKVQTTKAKLGSLTQEQQRVIQNILKYLNNAASLLEQSDGKGVSTNSFSSTINNIFSTQLGEYISKSLLTSALTQGLNDTDNILYKMGQGINGVKVIGNANSKFTQGGGRHDTSGTTSKVDIFNSNGFSLIVEELGQEFNIELSLNTSVKWYRNDPTMNNSQIHIVQGTSINKYFVDGSPEKYLAYNIIAHRWNNEAVHEAYRAMRAATAASFFSSWLSGTGEQIRGSKVYKNKAQFIMVNGKIYSMMRIVRNICDQLAARNAWDESSMMPFQMHVAAGSPGKWVDQEDGESKTEAALRRSAMQREVLNVFKIAASFNSNILTQYAY